MSKERIEQLEAYLRSVNTNKELDPLVITIYNHFTEELRNLYKSQNITPVPKVVTAKQ